MLFYVGDRGSNSYSSSEKRPCLNQNAYDSLSMYDKSKPRSPHQEYGQLQTAEVNKDLFVSSNERSRKKQSNNIIGGASSSIITRWLLSLHFFHFWE